MPITTLALQIRMFCAVAWWFPVFADGMYQGAVGEGFGEDDLTGRSWRLAVDTRPALQFTAQGHHCHAVVIAG